MKINLAVETAEFNFIKHAIEQQTNQLVQYMDSMFKVAVHLNRTPEEIQEDIELTQRLEDFDKRIADFNAQARALGPEKVVKAPKRRGRPPAKKRGRPAKAKA